ncbi:hypothetical protein NOF04DRAFT_1338094 [Fusarium oxysporum II5]|uniref:Uncharacterized protein n=3 Tax=Fusarium oxysporum species complex TaxID=171631 RepID=N1S2T1_FUSC4|nr:hypothetical protein FOC4_g10000329 [Fusarium odoratissimum]ENH68894.1 hypothetical protein FOC1_g10000291 [Fusarium oxysporum f. sp. cubense race 1]KAK2122035.1 hypothetical protein NOF04DRAFT_1336604 [Fusarium oxysporum II5]TVY74758.1 hypothetical protein Focb16_v005410 [Fusarium oxysporum f. sp. cubense]EMT72389.1 hypothetical protein FOC4_g10000331 [Fusarium odoratissimum]
MRNVRAKQGYPRTVTPLNKFSPSSQGSKRRKLESNIPMPMLLAVEDSDKGRSGRHEAEAGDFTPSSSLDTRSESTPASPKRFFTSDGYDECLKTALHRSRCEAELDKWRCLSVMGEATAQPPETKDQSPSSPSSPPCVKTHSHSPPPDEPVSPKASQESYGGDWVDEVADELLPGGLFAVTSSPRNTAAADQANSLKVHSATTRH